jgi:hypothetical protein
MAVKNCTSKTMKLRKLHRAAMIEVFGERGIFFYIPIGIIGIIPIKIKKGFSL